MMLSFTLMGGAIIVMALIPPYSMIGVAAPVLAIIARLAMGFSLGGEVGPTTAYLLEAAPVEKRGLMVAWRGDGNRGHGRRVGGLRVGRRDEPDGAELIRVAHRLPARRDHGAVRALDPSCLARNTPHRRDGGVRRSKSTAPGRRAGELRIIVLGLIILAYGTIGTYVSVYMTTFAQDTLHMSSGPAFAVAVVSNLATLVGALSGGWLSDRIGRRPVMIWPNLAKLLITYPVFLWLVIARSPIALLTGMGLLSLIGSVATGGFYVALAENLPKPIRGGAFATIYAVAIATFGGTCQLVIRWLIHATGNPMSPAWYLLAATVIGQVAMMMFPESAPARLFSSCRSHE